jgi:hypothetical protein
MSKLDGKIALEVATLHSSRIFDTLVKFQIDQDLSPFI